jgi:hypothetical protein
MKLNFKSLEVKRKINLLAEICHYGIEWNFDLKDNSGYVIGGVETTAHILSCCIVQWFGFECCGTGETRDFLELEAATDCKKSITIKEWEKRITKYLKFGVDGQQN